MTQVKYANELGVEARTVSRWENGTAEPGALAFLNVLALAGIDFADILDKMLEIPDALEDAPLPTAYSVDRLKFETREAIALARTLLDGQTKISQQLARVADDLRRHDAEMERRVTQLDPSVFQAAVRSALQDEEASAPVVRRRRRG